MKKLLPVLLVTAVTMSLLVGCTDKEETSSKGEETSSKVEESKDGMSLTLCIDSTDEAITIKMDSMAAEYKELTGVDVEIEYVPNADVRTYLTTQFTAGKGPDIYSTIDYNMVSDYESGWIADLSEYYEKESAYDTGILWKDTLPINVTERITLEDGAIAGYPTYTSVVRIFCNSNIFEAAGASIPNTWDEFMETCEKIKQSGVTPFAFPNATSADISWFWFNNSLTNQVWPDLIEEIDTDGSGFVDSPEMLQAIESGLVDFTDEKVLQTYELMKEFSQYWTSDFNSLDSNTAFEMFARQEVAMMQAHSGELNKIEDMIGGEFQYEVMPMPAVTEETISGALGKSVILGGQPDGIYVVNKALEEDKAKFDVAIDFIQFASSAESQLELVEEIYRIPLNDNIDLPQSLQGFKITEEPLRTQVYGWDQNIRNTITRGGQMFLANEITALELGEMMNLSYEDMLKAKEAE